MHNIDFFQLILIPDNYLLLMTDTDKKTDDFMFLYFLKIRSESSVYAHLSVRMAQI